MGKIRAKTRRSISEATAGYEERYCAFVDILGFSDEVLSDLRTESLRSIDVRDLLLQFHAPVGRDFLDIPFSDFRSLGISDAVALSTNLIGLGAIIFAAEHLATTLLRQGFLIRGAICKGRLYHSSSMVFGDALVEAYRLESQVARVPRILVSDDVVADMAPPVPTSHMTKWYIKRGEDGLHFLNIFRQLEYSIEHNCRELHNAYLEMAAALQARFNNSLTNPIHLEKVQWLAREWNAALLNADEELKKIAIVSGPGLKPLIPKKSVWPPEQLPLVL